MQTVGFERFVVGILKLVRYLTCVENCCLSRFFQALGTVSIDIRKCPHHHAKIAVERFDATDCSWVVVINNEYVAFLARLESITLRHFRPAFHGMTRHFVKPASHPTGNTAVAARVIANSESVNA